jgi:hypothetical protein
VSIILSRKRFVLTVRILSKRRCRIQLLSSVNRVADSTCFKYVSFSEYSFERNESDHDADTVAKRLDDHLLSLVRFTLAFHSSRPSPIPGEKCTRIFIDVLRSFFLIGKEDFLNKKKKRQSLKSASSLSILHLFLIERAHESSACDRCSFDDCQCVGYCLMNTTFDRIDLLVEFFFLGRIQV